METALLSPVSGKQLCDSVDAFLFECDGVVWKGNKLIDGVSPTLELLRAMGKKLGFVTNGSAKTRKFDAEKFLSLGISVSEDEIFCSSFAAAMYLKSIQFPLDKKVYVIGENGLLDELALAGFVDLGGPEDGKKAEFKNSSIFQHDKRGGCMVAAVCGSMQKEPVVVGKPSTFLMDFLLKKFDISSSRMCMVGNRLETDILFRQNAGCKTLLVLSGVTTESVLQDPSNEIQLDY